MNGKHPIRCAYCGKPATHRYGLADPDMTGIPLCDAQPCLDRAMVAVFAAIEEGRRRGLERSERSEERDDAANQ